MHQSNHHRLLRFLSKDIPHTAHPARAILLIYHRLRDDVQERPSPDPAPDPADASARDFPERPFGDTRQAVADVKNKVRKYDEAAQDRVVYQDVI